MKQAHIYIAVLITALFAISACSSSDGDDEVFIPTVAVFFSGDEVPTLRPTLTPLPTGTPLPTPLPTPEIIYHTELVFDEELADGWVLDSNQMGFGISSNWAYSGQNAIRIVPQGDFASFFITLSEEATQIYPRDDIYGFSFYLSGQSIPIGNEDFVVTAQGSNEFTYWVPGDESARVDGGPIFSETRLMFLDLNNAIPADTWVQIEFPLNERQFDPPYDYFTGFYIKNDAGVASTIYIDKIEMITIEIVNEAERMGATPTPTP